MDAGILFGMAALCGIGFTMSLFIGGLAFGETGVRFDERLGILVGSLVSAAIGLSWLHLRLPAAGVAGR